MTAGLERELVERVRILLISGSICGRSYTRTLTEHVERALWGYDVATIHWNLRDRPLPFADPDFHDDPRAHPDDAVRELVALADVADGFVLASPVYHNSYTGVLKNALDHLAIRQFRYKPVGLLGHGGNRSPQSVDHLRIVVRGLLGVAIPTQVCTLEHDYRSVGPNGYELESEDVLNRIERFAGELIVFSHQLRASRQAAATI